MKYKYKGLIVTVLKEQGDLITLRNIKDDSAIVADKQSFKQFFVPIREQKPLPVKPEPQTKQEKKDSDFTPKTRIIKKGKKEIEVVTLF